MSTKEKIDQYIREFDSLTIPTLFEYFRAATVGNEQHKEAEILLGSLVAFMATRPMASVAAQCLAATAFLQKMCERAAISNAEAEAKAAALPGPYLLQRPARKEQGDR